MDNNDFSTPIDTAPEPEKKNNTVIIIVAVVAVLLLCCCCIGSIAIYWLWNHGDTLIEQLSYNLPALVSLL